MCQSHGFPKIMGVLTHLDVFKNNKKLKKRKKTLKQRSGRCFPFPSLTRRNSFLLIIIIKHLLFRLKVLD